MYSTVGKELLFILTDTFTTQCVPKTAKLKIWMVRLIFLFTVNVLANTVVRSTARTAFSADKHY